MIELVEYLDDRGRSPYARWRDGLDAGIRAKLLAAILRLCDGNVSNVKSAGNGVQELRIHSGPGYRVYFGREGGKVILLLGGGTKRRQQVDIEQASERWDDYKTRKRANEATYT